MKDEDQKNFEIKLMSLNERVTEVLNNIYSEAYDAIKRRGDIELQQKLYKISNVLTTVNNDLLDLRVKFDSYANISFFN